MTAPLYPVAETAEAALYAARGAAARQAEAERAAGGPVVFATEWVGPAFATRDAALDAYVGRVADERPGRAASPPSADWCVLRPVPTGGGRPPAPVRPLNAGGRRWPEPEAAAPASWRLSVTYWRIASETEDAPLDPARRMRRHADGAGLGGRELQRLSAQPLRPAANQRALDIGLFETRLPERPDIIIPDE